MLVDVKRLNSSAMDADEPGSAPLKPGSHPWRAAIALAAAAPLYAATTWQIDYTSLVARHYAFPVLLVELYVVLLAVAAGFRPVDASFKLAPLTRFALVAWLLAVFAGAITAARPGTATAHAAVVVLHGLFALALWDRFTTAWRGLQTALLTALGVGAAIYAILVHVLALTVMNDPGFNWAHFGPGVSNVRQLGFYGLGLVGIGVGLLAGEKAVRLRGYPALLLLAGYYMVDWSGGRAAYGAALGATVVTIALAPRHSRGRTAAIALGTFILAMPLSLLSAPTSAWGILSILSRSAVAEAPQYFSGRLEVWKQTLDLILDRPLLGYGLGQFRNQVPAAGGFFNHPHNSLLQFVFQWGFFGTAALAAAAWGLVKDAAARLRMFPVTALPAVGVLTGMALMSLLEGNFYHVYPLMVSMVCLAALGSTLQHSKVPQVGASTLTEETSSHADLARRQSAQSSL